jgi:hypothetical protein
MIIPIKCFTCGNVLADKYRYYLAEVRRRTTARRPTVPRPKRTDTAAKTPVEDGEYKKVVRKRSAKSSAATREAVAETSN